ncbi:MAG: ATP phosphoribosyltransferase [Candidatus Aminicenantes bacterium]|nr:ATP phosphoribosyltransferase [Candidatus Aminicenantes bacterium]
MNSLKMVIPKGRLYGEVVRLLNDAGFGVETDPEAYRPSVGLPGFEAKILKPQNIPRLVELGAHDIGFTGHDWVVESGARLVEVMDLGFNPVRIAAAVTEGFSEDDALRRRLIVASEYETIAGLFLAERGYDAVLIRTFGATEVFPPDDADMIVDNVSTGRTLRAHGLRVFAEILQSTTRLVADPAALEDPWKREKIEGTALLLRGVLDARRRVMLEMNVPADRLDNLVALLPCMRSPTVSPLFAGQGYAVKAAVPRAETARLIPLLKKAGASDILEYEFGKVIL